MTTSQLEFTNSTLTEFCSHCSNEELMMTTVKVLVTYLLTLFSHLANSPVLKKLEAFLTIMVSLSLSLLEITEIVQMNGLFVLFFLRRTR